MSRAVSAPVSYLRVPDRAALELPGGGVCGVRGRQALAAPLDVIVVRKLSVTIYRRYPNSCALSGSQEPSHPTWS
jgi:hypothetical protein